MADSVLGHEVGDGGADGAATDVVFAGEAGDGLAVQVRGAHGVGSLGLDGCASPPLLPFASAARSPS
ncbi:hypothetical protein [Streptomyces sp. SID12501]|uniref:Uncharacterized protein n=1 Tax=Streptomyces sp. SID12501 TaxID=2706042 RepID=A0A6B3BPX2_9ACTN|nr:hypothetical protein [Streptomyces sp. SID12501]